MLSRVSTQMNRSAFARRSFAKKIKVTGQICDLDGDEMTRIIWDNIKAKVSLLFLKSNTKYFETAYPPIS